MCYFMYAKMPGQETGVYGASTEVHFFLVCFPSLATGNTNKLSEHGWQTWSQARATQRSGSQLWTY